MAVVSEALNLVGVPARNHPKDDESHSLGIDPETGFDCSGFVIYVLNKVGLLVPASIRHASELFDQYGVFVHRYRPGDLVFFSNDGRAPSHVGIMINEGEYIHSPGKDHSVVTRSQISDRPIAQRFMDQIYLRNPIGYKAPAIVDGRWQKII